VNAGGPGDPDTITNQRTSAAPQGAPASDLRPSNVTNCVIGLIWSPVANAEGYRMQYRIHDSGHDWTDTKFKQGKAVITNIRANTMYDLRVAALFPPRAALGPWTTIKVATTGPRIPKWSDLVIASDTQSEIDVTRVQMLFFTVIVALFVALRIVSSGEIPAIPEGYLLLMGISNGVYLTAKFVPG
jgi:hypothetical protein